MWHNHANTTCLPCASLNSRGGLLLDASDLSHAHEICFQICVSRLYNEVRGLYGGIEVHLYLQVISQARGYRDNTTPGTYSAPSSTSKRTMSLVILDYVRDVSTVDATVATGLLNVLIHDSEASLISGLIEPCLYSGAARLWALSELGIDDPAALGEYGYIDRGDSGERFVRLGHLDDLLDMEAFTTCTGHSAETQNGRTPSNYTLKWPDNTFR